LKGELNIFPAGAGYPLLHSGAYLGISLSPCHKRSGSGFSQIVRAKILKNHWVSLVARPWKGGGNFE
jgi:hypothetical protein